MATVEGTGVHYNPAHRPIVEAYIRNTRSPLRSWFKAPNVADRTGLPVNAVAKVLAAMWADSECPLVVERRSGSTSYVYRVRSESESGPGSGSGGRG